MGDMSPNMLDLYLKAVVQVVVPSDVEASSQLTRFLQPDPAPAAPAAAPAEQQQTELEAGEQEEERESLRRASTAPQLRSNREGEDPPPRWLLTGTWAAEEGEEAPVFTPPPVPVAEEEGPDGAPSCDGFTCAGPDGVFYKNTPIL